MLYLSPPRHTSTLPFTSFLHPGMSGSPQERTFGHAYEYTPWVGGSPK
jgi:hypothetical protein